jgi:hypothetical protein
VKSQGIYKAFEGVRMYCAMPKKAIYNIYNIHKYTKYWREAKEKEYGR